jgi:hypothetical protein
MDVDWAYVDDVADGMDVGGPVACSRVEGMASGPSDGKLATSMLLACG